MIKTGWIRIASNGAAASAGAGSFSIYNSDSDAYRLEIYKAR